MAKTPRRKGRQSDLVLLGDLSPRKGSGDGRTVKPVFGAQSLGSESALRPAPEPGPARKRSRAGRRPGPRDQGGRG